MRQNFLVFNLYRNDDLDDQTFYWLLTSMTVVQALIEDVRNSFLFMGDFNGHYQEWFGSRPRTVMVLQPLTLQLCLVAISLLSVRSM